MVKLPNFRGVLSFREERSPDLKKNNIPHLSVNQWMDNFWLHTSPSSFNASNQLQEF
jgi:hypothetical protein